MTLDLANYHLKAQNAIKIFWQNRDSARIQHTTLGGMDRGERSAVTQGKNLDGFIDLISDIVTLNGLPATSIYRNRGITTLPGYFRPTKAWDLLIIHEERLVAALEFKSHIGPSFGNNFNNRVEEALGSAIDLWTAYREGALGSIQRPFIGWLMLLEDCPESQQPRKERTKLRHFTVLPEFQGKSYAERYSIFCQKLVQERLYTTATLLTSPRTALHTGEYTTLSEISDLTTFVSTLAGYIAAEAARYKNKTDLI
ncbi:PaeR7I family type II restriction endonuclease [Herpetosiphon llansteffanensis]|uniref:PaeR7I family type II restriction endonuclease n=1 Tax=Herpetosiphon llansteffanensis TaxID=2094568 RepID=UPI000D7B9BC2|nr:PaeR7I family type II restriction endonuclease [Herpetosiphon llansteffanensis]